MSNPLYGIPSRLIIPSLNVDANAVQLGLTKNSLMEAPIKLTDVGWYKFGPHPGDVGSAVIAGHAGVGTPGIFANLGKLKKGDLIISVDDKGQRISFTVRESKTYSSDGQPKEVFRSNDGVHLNLITCSGTWQKGLKTYSQRLVVFADLTN